MIINNSHGFDNWSQRKNLNEPFATCNVTACINAAQSSGHDVMACRKGLADRPADDLLLFIKSDVDCNKSWESHDPNFEIPINQWMSPLALGLSKWLGNIKYAEFKMSDWAVMRDNIIKGGCCVVSGKYKTVKKSIDHITALVGINYDETTLKVSEWIMDDSYGDYHTRYETQIGNDIIMPHSDFITMLKEQNSSAKRCIFVYKKEK